MHHKPPLLKSLKDISPSDWSKLSNKIIFFGHQSVGENICHGLQYVLQNNPSLTLQLIETNSVEKLYPPAFIHYKIGSNNSPSSKDQAFNTLLHNGLGKKIAIGMYKYCYVDITETTDVESVFSAYAENIAELQKTFPSILFVHVTVPLTIVQTGPKVFIKKIIGRKIGGYNDNIRRNQFNDLMRQKYIGKEPIFDLALIEASHFKGNFEIFQYEGGKYLALAPEHSTDGRHLNNNAARVIAEQLLIFITELAALS